MIIPDFCWEPSFQQVLKAYIRSRIYRMGIAHQLRELAGRSITVTGEKTRHIPETDPECVSNEILERIFTSMLAKDKLLSEEKENVYLRYFCKTADNVLMTYRTMLNRYLRQRDETPIRGIDDPIGMSRGEDEKRVFGDRIPNPSSDDPSAILQARELEPELLAFLQRRFKEGPPLFEEYFLLITGRHSACYDQEKSKRKAMSGRKAAEYLAEHHHPLPSGCSMPNLAKHWDKLAVELMDRFRIRVRKERVIDKQGTVVPASEETSHEEEQ